MTDVVFHARCKAFGGKVAVNRIQVSIEDRAIRVWDDVAGHYTRCHSLSDRTVQRFLRRGLEQAATR